MEICSDPTVSKRVSIELQHCFLYLLCGLYKHVNNHFSLRMITSNISASTGVWTDCSTFSTAAVGQIITYISHDTPPPPPCSFRSARWHLKPGILNCADGKDPSSFVSDTNIMSKIFFDISSDISMNLLRKLLIFEWPLIMFLGCESLNFFSVDIKSCTW